MKRLIILLPFLILSQASYSQVLISLLFGDKLNSDKIEFGLDGGFNFSNISNLESSNRLSTLNLGFYFDIKMNEHLYLSTGVLVKSTLGQNELSDSDLSLLAPDLELQPQVGSYSQRLNYFHVPIAAKYRFKNNFYLKFGTQLGLLNGAKLVFDAEEDDTVVSIETKNVDDFKRFEAGLLGGIGYKLKQGQGMNIGLKYYYGLTNVYAIDGLSGTNDAFYIKVDIPVGAGKAKEKNKG